MTGGVVGRRRVTGGVVGQTEGKRRGGRGDRW